MQADESMMYIVRRKSNNGRKEVLTADDLDRTTLSDEDVICANDGKGKWFTYSAFKKTREPLTPLSDLLPIKQTAPTSPDASTAPLPLPEPIPELDSEVIKMPDSAGGSTSKRNPVRLLVAVLVVSLVAIATALLIQREEKSDNVLTGSSDRRPPVSNLAFKQAHLEKTLIEGVQHLEVNSLHDQANLRFYEVADMLTKHRELNRNLVNTYVRKYQQKGDHLCQGQKTAFLVELANQYYKHAAILSNNTHPTVCR